MGRLLKGGRGRPGKVGAIGVHDVKCPNNQYYVKKNLEILARLG